MVGDAVFVLVSVGEVVSVLVIVLADDVEGVPLLLNVPEREEVAVFVGEGDEVGDRLLVTVLASEDVRDGVMLPVLLAVRVTVIVDEVV